MRISLFSALLLSAGACTSAAAQVVHGRLVDAGTGAAVASARVRLLRAEATADSALTDSAGAFVLRADDGGAFRLSAERVGYPESRSGEVEFAPEDSVEVLFRISPDAVVLEPLEVVATTRRRGPWLDAFYRRLETKRFGHFVTREQIDRRRPMYASELLRMVPGLRLIPSRFGGYVVRGRGGCVPVVVVDGLHVRSAGGRVDELVTAHDLEGIEIYTGPGQAPGEFAMHDSGCTLILLWTRSSN